MRPEFPLPPDWKQRRWLRASSLMRSCPSRNDSDWPRRTIPPPIPGWPRRNKLLSFPTPQRPGQSPRETESNSGPHCSQSERIPRHDTTPQRRMMRAQTESCQFLADAAGLRRDSHSIFCWSSKGRCGLIHPEEFCIQFPLRQSGSQELEAGTRGERVTKHNNIKPSECPYV